MLVRPSLVLQIKLGPQDYSPAAADELKRSYIYLAQSIVSELPEGERADGNIMRLSIRLMRPYWDDSDPKARELWDGVMPQWLRNAVRNVSTAMHNYNEVDHPEGIGPVLYDWADLEFGHDALLRVKVDSENRITPQAPGISEKARALLNRGAFGDGEVALIRVPSADSFASQVEAAVKRREAALAEAGREAAGDAGPSSAEGPEPAADAGGPLAADAFTAAEESKAATPSEPAIPPFDIDFSVWGVEFSDGTVVEFDSSAA